MAAIRKAGYSSKAQPSVESSRNRVGQDEGVEPIAGPPTSANLTTVQVLVRTIHTFRSRALLISTLDYPNEEKTETC